jgi:hypothetical protein
MRSFLWSVVYRKRKIVGWWDGGLTRAWSGLTGGGESNMHAAGNRYRFFSPSSSYMIFVV